MSTLSTDKERYQRRTSLMHNVRVAFARETSDGREMMVSGRIVNQSVRGFCILTTTLVKEGEILRALTDAVADSECYFHVRWVKRNGADITFGCNFVDLSNKDALN